MAQTPFVFNQTPIQLGAKLHFMTRLQPFQFQICIVQEVKMIKKNQSLYTDCRNSWVQNTKDFVK